MKIAIRLLLTTLVLIVSAKTATAQTTPKQRNLQVVVPVEAQIFWKAWATERNAAEEKYRKLEKVTQRIQETVNTNTASNIDLIKAIKTANTEYLLRSLELSSAILDATKEAEKHFTAITSGGSQNELLISMREYVAQKGVSQKWQIMMFKEPTVTVNKEKWKKLQEVDPRLTKPLFISIE